MGIATAGEVFSAAYRLRLVLAMEAGVPSASAASCPSLWVGGLAEGQLYLLLPLGIHASGSMVLSPGKVVECMERVYNGFFASIFLIPG